MYCLTVYFTVSQCCFCFCNDKFHVYVSYRIAVSSYAYDLGLCRTELEVEVDEHRDMVLIVGDVECGYALVALSLRSQKYDSFRQRYLCPLSPEIFVLPPYWM